MAFPFLIDPEEEQRNRGRLLPRQQVQPTMGKSLDAPEVPILRQPVGKPLDAIESNAGTRLQPRQPVGKGLDYLPSPPINPAERERARKNNVRAYIAQSQQPISQPVQLPAAQQVQMNQLPSNTAPYQPGRLQPRAPINPAERERERKQTERMIQATDKAELLQRTGQQLQLPNSQAQMNVLPSNMPQYQPGRLGPRPQPMPLAPPQSQAEINLQQPYGIEKVLDVPPALALNAGAPVNQADIPYRPGMNVPPVDIKPVDPYSIPDPAGPVRQTGESPQSFERDSFQLQKRNGNFDDGYQKTVRGAEMPLGSMADAYGELSPVELARRELGAQKGRGFGRVLKDGLLGFLGGGLLGIPQGLVKGGDYRYQNQLEQRAGEIAQTQQLQRQGRLDRDASLYKQAQAENLVEDNRRLREDLTRRTNEGQQRNTIQQERNAIARSRIGDQQLKTFNDIARNLKGTGQPLSNEVAAGLGLPEGTILENDPKNPAKYSVLKFRDGRVLKLDKVSGDLSETGYEDLPVNAPKPPRESELVDQAENTIYRQFYDKYRGRVPNSAYAEEAQKLAKQLGVDVNHRRVKRQLDKMKIPEYFSIKDSPAYQDAVYGEVNRLRGEYAKGQGQNSRPAPNNSQQNQQLTQAQAKFAEVRGQLEQKYGNDPQLLQQKLTEAARRFQAQYGLSPQ